MLEWLQQWYLSNCDGNWEHENGVQINTLDNPGWLIDIDLKKTSLEGLEIPYSINEISETEWEAYSISNNVFKGRCSPNKLNRVIEIFKEIVESH